MRGAVETPMVAGSIPAWSGYLFFYIYHTFYISLNYKYSFPSWMSLPVDYVKLQGERGL